jgi:hypothetical protein
MCKRWWVPGDGVCVWDIRACALKWWVGGTARQDATGPSIGPSPLVLLGPLGSEGAAEHGCRLPPSLWAPSIGGRMEPSHSQGVQSRTVGGCFACARQSCGRNIF